MTHSIADVVNLNLRYKTNCAKLKPFLTNCSQTNLNTDDDMLDPDFMIGKDTVTIYHLVFFHLNSERENNSTSVDNKLETIIIPRKIIMKQSI